MPDRCDKPQSRFGVECLVFGVASVALWFNAALMLVIVLQVILRYAFSKSAAAGFLVGFEELQWHLYGSAAVLSLSYCVITDTHVRIDLLHRKFSDKQKALVEILGNLLFLLPLVVVVFDHSMDFALKAFEIGERSASPMGLPERWVIKAFLPISFLLLALAVIPRSIRAIKELCAKLEKEPGASVIRGKKLLVTVGAVLGVVFGVCCLMLLLCGLRNGLVVAIFAALIVLLLSGYPIAFVLAGVGLHFTWIGYFCDEFLNVPTGLDYNYLGLLVKRYYGNVMSSSVLVALPMFVFMGLMLERSGIAARMMNATQDLFGRVRGGLAITVIIIGMLLAAATGIIGASVVLLGILALPVMLKQGYSKPFAAGTVCSAGTLGILMPPSIMLVIMADQVGVSVGDLFIGAVFPSIVLGALYVVYVLVFGFICPDKAPLPDSRAKPGFCAVWNAFASVLPAIGLILLVLGSIFMGFASPTEASGLGAFGACVLAGISGRLRWSIVIEALRKTFEITGYILGIFVGALCFSLALRALGGDEIIGSAIRGIAFGPMGVVACILAIVFMLGFFLDWIEITLILLPIVAPVIAECDFGLPAYPGIEHPVLVWFCVLMAVTLQTSFLTPPVGFALFYLMGVCPGQLKLSEMYRGVIPYVVLQLVGLGVVLYWPEIVLWLPSIAYD